MPVLLQARVAFGAISPRGHFTNSEEKNKTHTESHTVGKESRESERNHPDTGMRKLRLFECVSVN